MDSTAPNPVPSQALELGCLALAGLELLLAVAAHLFAAAGMCPVEQGPVWGCATLVRPRLVQLLGPLTVTQVALVGATLSLFLSVLLRAGHLELAPARWSARVLSLGAGFALGIQALAPTAGAGICPLCLALALAALATAVVFGLAVQRRHGLGLPTPWLLAAAILCGLLATAAGIRLGEADGFRREQVPRAGKTPDGPRVQVVVRDGCVFCEALVLDVLAEPEVLSALAAASQVELVDGASRAGRALVGRGGVPLLVVRDRDGSERARLRGLRTPAELERWLATALTN